MSNCKHWLAGLGVPVVAGPALAHVDVQGPAFAGTNQEITFTVGHGCSGLDTLSVRIEIPPEVTAVRLASSNLGRGSIETNEAELVSAVTFEKSALDLYEGDYGFYRIVLRLRIPAAPFTSLVFPATQICSSPDGTQTATVLWTALGEHEGEHGEDEPGPAPVLSVLPARVAGWNKYVVPAALTDLADVFGDARIVWKGNAAFSNNPTTASQIANTPGVTALTTLAAGDEIWVSY